MSLLRFKVIIVFERDALSYLSNLIPQHIILSQVIKQGDYLNNSQSHSFHVGIIVKPKKLHIRYT